MTQHLDMAHVLGMIAKWSIITVAFVFSIVLSFGFFAGIAPPDKPWFPWIAECLTEGGFALWLIVFLLTHHHPVQKSLALLMTGACALCCLAVAGYELYGLIATHYDIKQSPGAIQAISILLVTIFAFHMISLIIDMVSSYFSKPGHEFRLRADVRDVPQYAYANENISQQDGDTLPHPITTMTELQPLLDRYSDSLRKGTRAIENKSQEEKGPGFWQKTKDYVSGKPMQLEHTRKPGRRGADYIVPKQEKQLNSFTTEVSTDAKIPE